MQTPNVADALASTGPTGLARVLEALAHSKPNADRSPEALKRHADATTFVSTLLDAPTYEERIAARLAALEKCLPIGGHDISVVMRRERGAPVVSISCYVSRGYNDHFRTVAPTFDEAADEFAAQLVARAAEFDDKRVRRLALRVIELTADFGECTAAQLRRENDSAELSAELRKRVTDEANRLATSGQPFVIVDAPAGNGAPSDDEDETDGD